MDDRRCAIGPINNSTFEFQRMTLNAALNAGLGEGIGQHTFRHTYRSRLDETGAPIKVKQELMRHASIQTTMNVYGRAMSDSKRSANSNVVEMVLGAAQPTRPRENTRFGRKNGE